MDKTLSDSIARCQAIGHEESINVANFIALFLKTTAAATNLRATCSTGQRTPRRGCRGRSAFFSSDACLMEARALLSQTRSGASLVHNTGA